MTDDFIGQQRLVTYFGEALQRGQLSHAYLFSGPAHIGKTTFVESLARMLVCNERKACGTCDSCRAWFEHTHQDCKVLKPEGARISVEEVRSFVDDLSRSPSMSRLHVGIIHEADSMTIAAANAFLKTLEEPAANVVLLALARDVNAMPATVRSRVAHSVFTPVTRKELAESLEARGIDHHKADELAALSRGLPGLTLDWLQHPDALASYRREAEEFSRLLLAQPHEQFTFVETMATEEKCAKSELERRLDHWLGILHDGLLTAANHPELTAHRLKTQSNIAPWRSAIEALLQARRDLALQANRRLALNNFFMHINFSPS